MVLAQVASASVAVAAFAFLCLRRSPERSDKSKLKAPGEPVSAQGYILENTVTHARLLPAPSTHRFTYPTLALLVSLDALERGQLDLARGWLFGYGGTAGRVTGLRSGAYLAPTRSPCGQSTSSSPQSSESDQNANARVGGNGSIKERLRAVLEEFGCLGEDEGKAGKSSRLGEVWMLTMPSYFGYEGINPLTVYYCYDGEDGESRGRLACVVLEIHNTFGEKHVHVLRPGVAEDESSAPGFDHQWTFARDFHVSPFNDRLGHYTVAVSVPPTPFATALLTACPRPKIRIQLFSAATLSQAGDELGSVHPDRASSQASKGELKLIATLSARSAVPLTSSNLVRTIARYPFALFLSFARILYHAGILHYVKRLDVFPRPDPKPAMREWGALNSGSPASTGTSSDTGTDESAEEERAYGGIGWQDEGVLEAYARRLVDRFLARRADELTVNITLVSGDPSFPSRTFAPTSGPSVKNRLPEQLTIHYSTTRFSTTLLLAPSPALMLALGKAEDLFRVNSETLFSRVFSTEEESAARTSYMQTLRTSLLPKTFLSSVPADIPPRHPLDRGCAPINAVVVCLLHFADRAEKMVFGIVGARFVPGLEPWRRWERAAVFMGKNQVESDS